MIFAELALLYCRGCCVIQIMQINPTMSLILVITFGSGFISKLPYLIILATILTIDVHCCRNRGNFMNSPMRYRGSQMRGPPHQGFRGHRPMSGPPHGGYPPYGRPPFDYPPRMMGHHGRGPVSTTL